ncbi:MAG: UDP-N-acetylmuramate dehydrogenase [Synergistaceae bacterium]|nr:UDP-N-acetylmuramate dehydrogenase [Synergistaceae bacterium]
MKYRALIRDCPLGELNTWGSGGRCLWLAAPSSVAEALSLIAEAREEGTRLYLLGGGSNVLVQDGLLSAGVISTSALTSIKLTEAGGAMAAEVEAGLPVRRLLALSMEKNLGGLAFLTGIPGTVGGALHGNAGADGESFAPLVDGIETISRDGALRVWSREELRWSYRASPWSEDPLMITKAWLRLPFDDKDNIIKNIRYFAELKKGQPIGAKTAGCVFKNPPGASAGRLLDNCGCKELAVGGAVISPRHANFIENRGGASSRNIYDLAEICRKRVFERYGITLEYEVKFFGTF